VSDLYHNNFFRIAAAGGPQSGLVTGPGSHADSYFQERHTRCHLPPDIPRAWLLSAGKG